MARTQGADSAPRSKVGLTDTEWLVLRACSRLGSPALTRRIFREVQEEALCDYRHVLVALQRLHDRGYLLMTKESPRRSLWSLAVSYRGLLKEKIRRFVERTLGAEPSDLDLFYEVLVEFEAAEDRAGAGALLPGKLRVRLMDCLRLLVERKALRDALAKTFGSSLAVLESLPASAQAVLLIKAAGGYDRAAVLDLLDQIEGLEGELGGDVRDRIAGLREDLEGGTEEPAAKGA